MIEATFNFGHVTVIIDFYLESSLPSFLGMGPSVSKLMECVSFESAVTYWFYSYPGWHQGCIGLGGGCIRFTGSLLFVNFDLLVSLTAPQVSGTWLFHFLAYSFLFLSPQQCLLSRSECHPLFHIWWPSVDVCWLLINWLFFFMA